MAKTTKRVSVPPAEMAEAAARRAAKLAQRLRVIGARDAGRASLVGRTALARAVALGPGSAAWGKP